MSDFFSVQPHELATVGSRMQDLADAAATAALGCGSAPTEHHANTDAALGHFDGAWLPELSRANQAVSGMGRGVVAAGRIYTMSDEQRAAIFGRGTRGL